MQPDDDQSHGLGIIFFVNVSLRNKNGVDSGEFGLKDPRVVMHGNCYTKSALLYYTILYCTILSYALLFCTMLYYTILYHTSFVARFDGFNTISACFPTAANSSAQLRLVQSQSP